MRTIQPAARNPGDHPWLAGFLKQLCREDLVRRSSTPTWLIFHRWRSDTSFPTYWFDRDLQIADASQVFKGTRAAVSKVLTLRTIR